VITLTLLHPIQSTPVQSWTFEHEPVIRIGRSTDNHVILYSAVVSRHHVELRQLENNQWEIVSLGANGTYLDGKQISKVPVLDGVVIRLARSGPNIQIQLGSGSIAGNSEKSLRSRLQPTLPSVESTANGDQAPPTLSKPAKTAIDNSTTTQTNAASPAPKSEAAIVKPVADVSETNLNCTHHRAAEDMAFCPDCGQPLKVLQTIGDYQVIKTLVRDRLGTTQLIWREGQTLLLKSVNAGVDTSGELEKLFEARALALLKLDHPAVPRFVDFFAYEKQSCLVIEKVYGKDLHQVVSMQGALSEQLVVSLMLQVCDALAYLHQQSPPVLHLDLRPDNIVCRNVMPLNQASADTPCSQVMLTGFVSLQTLKMDTQSAVIGYQAPEQQQGHASLASDLFALGPILVYLLTAKEPGQFYAHREQGFRFYPEYVPGLSPAMVGVIRRLTNPNPTERFSDALEVAEALNQAVSATSEKL